MAEPSKTRNAAGRAKLSMKTGKGHNRRLEEAGLGAFCFMGPPDEGSRLNTPVFSIRQKI
jgi:hypothetical protein